MVNFEYKNSYGVKDLEDIVRILRAPGGCPWDAEQTHESIRRNFVEEAYEAVEAIDEKNAAHLKEELGDVLLQVMLHAQMEAETERLKTSLLSSVTHDLQTPLAAIMGSADSLVQVGDQVVIETRDYVYTYVIDTPPAKLTVKDVDTWVIDPVPGKKGVAPTQALITLTTCQDLFHSPDRAVGLGHLAGTAKK